MSSKAVNSSTLLTGSTTGLRSWRSMRQAAGAGGVAGARPAPRDLVDKLREALLVARAFEVTRGTLWGRFMGLCVPRTLCVGG